MSTGLNSAIARREATGTRRTAQHYQQRRPAGADWPQALTLRLAGAADESNLEMLAALDQQPELNGEVLLAFLGGELVAAMPLGGGRVIADPFVATTDAVSLLELRAHQLSRPATRPKLAGRPWFAALTLAGYHPSRGHDSGAFPRCLFVCWVT